MVGDEATGGERIASPGDHPSRHCMIVLAYYPLGETRVQREAEALVEAGFAVDVICLGDENEPKRESYRGVGIYRLPGKLDKRSLGRQLLSYLRFTVRAGLALTRLHRRNPYASAQVHNLPDFLVFSALFPKLQGVPVVIDLHDLMPEFFEGRFGPRRSALGMRLLKWQERLACRFADHVITVSHQWRDSLIARGVPEHKVSVVMNVADERIFRPREHRPPGNEFRLFYHGTVTYRYGVDIALRAVALLKDEIPELKLTVVGKGNLMPDLAALRHRLGLEKMVELRDELVLAEELPDLLAGADLGIVPYRDDVFTRDLVPTKLMEYTALGIPSVASGTEGIRAYFAGTSVDFFQPGDERDLARRIRNLYRHPALLSALAKRSENFVRHHNWRRMGAEYVDLVRRLVA